MTLPLHPDLTNPEKSEEYHRKYRKRNRKKIKDYQQKYRMANREKLKKYYLDNKESTLSKDRDKRRQQRQVVRQALGGKCVRCGFSYERALQVDHVQNNGARHRRKHGSSTGTYYRTILKNIDSGEYQLLCANCNWIKHYEWVHRQVDEVIG